MVAAFAFLGMLLLSLVVMAGIECYIWGRVLRRHLERAKP